MSSAFAAPDYANVVEDLSSTDTIMQDVNAVLDGQPDASTPDGTPVPGAKQDAPTGDKGKAAPQAPQADEQGFYQDEEGKWHRPNGEFASQDEAENASAVLAEAEGKPAPTGDGTAPAPDTKPAVEPVHDYQPVKTQVTEFAVKAGDGTPVSEFPELLFSFKSMGGKEFKDVPLDRVVRLAQSGVHNEQLAQDIVQFRRDRQQYDQQFQALQQSNEQWAAFYARALTDDNFRAAALAQFQQENSPEAVLRREQERFQQERQSMEAQRQWEGAAAYIQNRVGPAVEAIGAANPRVTMQEILGQSSILYNQIPRDRMGAIPYDRLYDVMAIVEQQLKPWAEQLQYEREQQAQASTAKERRRVTAAQVEAMKAKRALAHATSPVTGQGGIPGRAASEGSNGAARDKDGNFKSVEDWMEGEVGIPKWNAAR